jgi:chromosome segregation ATPase
VFLTSLSASVLTDLKEEQYGFKQMHQDQINDLLEQYNSSFSAIETRFVSLSAKLKSTRIERDSLATQLSSLKSSNSSLQVFLDDANKKTESLQRNVERLRLELEGKDRDAKEMREQVKRWQQLEGRGNEEIETERAKRIDLEVELKVEKDRVKEGKKRVRELLVGSILFNATRILVHFHTGRTRSYAGWTQGCPRSN